MGATYPLAFATAQLEHQRVLKQLAWAVVFGVALLIATGAPTWSEIRTPHAAPGSAPGSAPDDAWSLDGSGGAHNLLLPAGLPVPAASQAWSRSVPGHRRPGNLAARLKYSPQRLHSCAIRSMELRDRRHWIRQFRPTSTIPSKTPDDPLERLSPLPA